MFYRVAIQTHTVPPSWQWKSTPLSSLDALLRFLRLHRALPQDRLRVFCCDTREGLDEQFRREQGAMGMHAVTAVQFLRERLVSPGDATLEPWEPKPQQNQKAVSSADALSLSVDGCGKQTPCLGGLSKLDCKRLELECGAGGDHGLPYHFVFPPTWSQAQVWAELLMQVQRGELQV